MSQVYLPKPSEKAAVREALNYHYDAQSNELQRKAVVWEFTHWFLQGLRNIQLRGLLRDVPHIESPTDWKGRKRVKFESALVETIVEIGRLIGIDWAPAVQRTPGLGLGILRGESLAQATLDHMWKITGTEQFKITAALKLATYGGCGFLVSQPHTGGRNRWEPFTKIVPMWELRPLPACPVGVDEVGGLTYARWVPYDWLKSKLKGVKMPNPKTMKDVDAVDMPYGLKPSAIDAPQTEHLAFSLGGSSYSDRYIALQKGTDKIKDTTQYVELKESWLINWDDWTTHRYIMQIGRAPAVSDIDYTEDEWQDFYDGSLPICPLSIPRYTEVQSFYPRGFAERQIFINREMEYLFWDYIQNARNRDMLLGVSIPITSGFDLGTFQTNQKYRVYPYMPHPNAPGAKPDVIGPPNTNNEIGEALNTLAGAADKTANQGEVLYGGVPGKRVESARAMGLAVQAGNTGLAMAGESLAFAMSCMFKAQLSYVRYLVKRQGRDDLTARVNRIDETILGVVLDPENGSVKLAQFPLPDPASMSITIRSKDPRTKDMLVAKLKEELTQGTLDPISYLIMAFKEALDLPLLDKTPFYAHECAALEDVILFNDGVTPGDINSLKPNAETDQHQIHYKQHLQTCNTIAFKAASDSVQNALLDMVEYHRDIIQGPQGSGAAIAKILRDGGMPNPAMMQGMGIPQPNGMSTGNLQVA